MFQRSCKLFLFLSKCLKEKKTNKRSKNFFAVNISPHAPLSPPCLSFFYKFYLCISLTQTLTRFFTFPNRYLFQFHLPFQLEAQSSTYQKLRLCHSTTTTTSPVKCRPSQRTKNSPYSSIVKVNPPLTK